VLEGAVQVNTSDPTLVSWRLASQLENTLLGFQDVPEGQEARVRVRLMGHMVWSSAENEILYLDGQVFGRPGLRADNKTSRTDLIFKSGNGTRASDFESWFYLGRTTVG
jgi:hypothetical protein